MTITPANYVRWLISLLLLCVVSPLFAAELTAQLDRTTVSTNETFQLIVTYTGGQLAEDPDFKSLDADFMMLAKAKSTQMNLINNKATSQTQWMIDLAPRHTGRFQIPAFRLGKYHSTPLSMTVTASSPSHAALNQKKIFMEVSATPQTPFVASEVLYTVKLFYAQNFDTGASLSEPVVSNAIMMRVGGDTSYSVMRHQRRYGVLERHYAIFPQGKGELTIEPPVFMGDIIEGGMTTSLSMSFAGQTRAVRVTGQKINLQVNPPPPSAHGKPWLPAKEVTVTEEWSGSPAEINVGKPITRTIHMVAKGVTGEQLPSLSSQQFATDFNVYPNSPKVTTSSDGIDVIGERTEKITLIPTRLGQISQPPFQISWWNVEKKQWEVASLPARVFTVSGAGMSPLNVGALPEESKEAQRENRFNLFWIGIAGIFFAAWLATTLLWWLQKRALRSPMKLLLQSIEHGCMTNNPKATRRALFQLSLLLSEPEHLKEMLKRLDEAVYAYDPERWDGRSFWNLFNTLDLKQRTSQRKKTDEVLPPLYPEEL